MGSKFTRFCMKLKSLKIFFIITLLLSCDIDNDRTGDTQQFEWKTTSYGEAGIDESKINEAFDSASKLSYLYSILIIRDGSIVAEKYFNGHEKNNAYSIKSVSKSFLSAAAAFT